MSKKEAKEYFEKFVLEIPYRVEVLKKYANEKGIKIIGTLDENAARGCRPYPSEIGEGNRYDQRTGTADDEKGHSATYPLLPHGKVAHSDK